MDGLEFQKDDMPDSLTLTVVLACIKPLVSEICSQVKTHVGGLSSSLKSGQLISGISERAKELSQIKTLLCLEEAVSITEFYSPQYLTTPTSDRFEFHSVESAKDYSRMVVSGVAGQGKSTLFRYLALGEIAKHRLPLFIELRNYDSDTDLRVMLENELEVLGFPQGEDFLTKLLSGNYCTVFLDAFDEIPIQLQGRARKDIENIVRKFSPHRILVSSRPNLGIESSPYFTVGRLDYLSRIEALNALKKMCTERDRIDELKVQLSQYDKNISHLLTTHLMVALLLLHFRLTLKFPQTEQAFFDDLFDVLLRRHDQTKAFSRDRHSEATELELRELFCFITFACRQKGQIEIGRQQMVEICDQSNKFNGRELPPDKSLDDVVEGTNLILEEGGMCRFAHKSIQEFYAAKFLLNQPEYRIEKFLRGKIRDWEAWQQMLEFIELLNPYMFFNHFLLPHVGWMCFGDPEKNVEEGWIPSKASYVKIFGNDMIGISEQPFKYYMSHHASRFYVLKDTGRTIPSILGRVSDAIDWKTISPESATVVDQDFKLPHDDSDVTVFRVEDLLSLPDHGARLRDVLEPVLVDKVEKIHDRYAFLENQSSQEDLFS